MNKSKLIIMIGNIASGKTTWIKQFLADKSIKELKNWVVLSKDDLRRMLGAGKYIYSEEFESIIHRSFVDMLHNFMTWEVNIIIDETNMDKETRKVYLHLTKKFSREGYDYETIAVVMPKILREEIMIKRCQERDTFNWATKGGIEHWKNVWQEKNNKFEMPTKEEGFNEIREIK